MKSQFQIIFKSFFLENLTVFQKMLFMGTGIWLFHDFHMWGIIIFLLICKSLTLKKHFLIAGHIKTGREAVVCQPLL